MPQDLSGRNLSRADLSGANLSGANLSRAIGAELAIRARSECVDDAWLSGRDACIAGRAWVRDVLGGQVSYLDCLAHGKDDYAGWLYPRVLTWLIEQEAA